MSTLEGLVLINREFGYCKITDHTGERVRVRFCGTSREAWYSTRLVAEQRDFKWRPLPVGLKCEVKGRGSCSIVESSFRTDEASGVYEYVVEFDDTGGESAKLSERDLWPIPGSLIETPLTRIANLQLDPFPHYLAHEALTGALAQVSNEVSGIEALAASRVVLLPHQAFVVGTVVDDPIWRYILADEVGLGKTVEAGVIVHQLFASKPNARVLVLCPGPLARQWLCEMHLSFGGRDFHLLDIHPPRQVRLSEWTRVISSIKVAMRDHADTISAESWDLVIVDEAHHLLWNEDQYEFVERLSSRSAGLLLLSAIPAQERESELLRLLRLIDPTQYSDGSATADRFSDLYAAQRVIGRRVRIVSRHLTDPDDEDVIELHEDAKRLLACDVLKDDEELDGLRRAAEATCDLRETRRLYRNLVDEVVARYRISRRILKNRRARLVDADLLSSVTRVCQLFRYEPSELDREIAALTIDVLQSARESPVDRSVLYALFRKAVQAICDPVALYEVATALRLPDESGESALLSDANAVYDYDEHDVVLRALATSIGPHVNEGQLERFIALIRAAIDLGELPRIAALKACLDDLRRESARKIIVFAGAYGTASFLEEMLAKEHGSLSVAAFRHELDDAAKEAQVTRFRRDPSCWILVSDESGGEGRNFQFADVLVHFDLPWSVSAIEQRIGRLDRIGRDRPVKSVVLCPTGTIEAEWFEGLDQGFGVFCRSISGLEFMLRNVEHQIFDAVLHDGHGALREIIPSIREKCERERASDDADALTDAASFRSSSRYLRSLEASAGVMLENAAPLYLRSCARKDSARQVTDMKDANLKIWRLRPGDVSEFQLLGIERKAEDSLQERYGTFSRVTARERPDLEFFSVGHPVIDALADASRRYVRGRTFAVRSVSNDINPGFYLSVRWRVIPGVVGPEDVSIERTIRHLNGRYVHNVVDIETEGFLNEQDRRSVVELLDPERESTSDFRGEPLLEELSTLLDTWGARVVRMVRASEEVATEIHSERYGELDRTFCADLSADAAFVLRTRRDETPAYARSLECCIAALKNARVTLDSLGIVRVTGPQ